MTVQLNNFFLTQIKGVPATAEVDAWVIAMWLLVLVADKGTGLDWWQAEVEYRKELVAYLRMCSEDLYQSQLKFVRSATTSGTHHQSKIPEQRALMAAANGGAYLGTDKHDVETLFNDWANFILSPKFGVYYQVGEGLGAIAATEFEQGVRLDDLSGHLSRLDVTHATAFTEPGQRWSTFEYCTRQGETVLSYLAGPASLINHACFRHSNAVMKVDFTSRMQGMPKRAVVNVVADKHIHAVTRVYVCYDADEEALRQQRGLRCCVCNPIKV